MPNWKSANIPLPLWELIQRMIDDGIILYPNPNQFIVSTLIEKIEYYQDRHEPSISATTKDPQDDD